MKRTRRLLVAAALLAALSACKGIDPAADRATYDAIAPSYTAYVNADPMLSPADRATKLRTLETWLRRLEAQER